MIKSLVGILILALIGCGKNAVQEGRYGKDSSSTQQEVDKAKQKPSVQQALQRELRYSPAHATMVLSVDVEETLKSKFFAALPVQDRKEIVEGLTQDIGIPLATVARFTWIGAGIDGEETVVVTANTELDADRIIEQRLKRERTRKMGIEYLFQPEHSLDGTAKQWKKTVVQKYEIYEKTHRPVYNGDGKLLGYSTYYDTFCIPEPKVYLSINGPRDGPRVSTSLLRRVLQSDGEQSSLSDALRVALQSSTCLKTIDFALAVRGNPQMQTEALIAPTGDLRRIVEGVDWLTLQAALNSEGRFVGRVQIACTAKEKPDALQKHLEAQIAKLIAAADTPIAKMFLNELRRSLEWKEQNGSLVIDFSVDEESVFLMICDLGQNPNPSFSTNASKTGSASPPHKK